MNILLKEYIDWLTDPKNKVSVHVKGSKIYGTDFYGTIVIDKQNSIATITLTNTNTGQVFSDVAQLNFHE